MWWFFKTMLTESDRRGEARAPGETDRCRQAHTAFVQSLVLLFMFILLAVVVRTVLPSTEQMNWHHLFNDVTALFAGAQTAVLTYRVVVLREWCK